MKYQSFCMRVLCLLLILAAVIGYNSMQKKDTQEQETQEITQLKKRVDTLEEQQKEMLAALEEAAKNQETAKAQAKTDAKDNATKADSEDAESTDDSENIYKDGTYTGSAQGFGGAIEVQVTLKDDEITDIQVTSASGEDSTYLSQAQSVISSIISAQSTDVDTVSGATFSSTGIINAVIDAIGKAENE